MTLSGKQAWVFGALLACGVAACGTDDGQTLGTSGSGSSGGGSTSSGGQMEAPLPCELDAMLVDRCQECHGEEPKFGALRTLVSHDDLIASGDGHDTLAEACLTRMELPTNDEERMPLSPRPAASQGEVDLMRQFVNSGFPMRAEGETCE